MKELRHSEFRIGQILKITNLTNEETTTHECVVTSKHDHHTAPCTTIDAAFALYERARDNIEITIEDMAKTISFERLLEVYNANGTVNKALTLVAKKFNLVIATPNDHGQQHRRRDHTGETDPPSHRRRPTDARRRRTRAATPE